MIQRLVFRYGLGGGRPIWSSNVTREHGAELKLHEAATRLGIHRHTAYRWLRDGRLRGRVARTWRPAHLARADERRRTRSGQERTTRPEILRHRDMKPV